MHLNHSHLPYRSLCWDGQCRLYPVIGVATAAHEDGIVDLLSIDDPVNLQLAYPSAVHVIPECQALAACERWDLRTCHDGIVARLTGCGAFNVGVVTWQQ